MTRSLRRHGARTPALAFLLASVLLHLAALSWGGLLSPASPIALRVPHDIELGLLDEAPGESGAPPPVAAPTPPEPEKRRRERPAHQDDDGATIAPDAGVAVSSAEQTAAEDEAEPSAPSPRAGADAGAAPTAASGDGISPGGVGEGLGFGAGGFGSGSGGPLGAVIALHADLDRIRSTSLVLETSALLEIVPEWQRLLEGSGLDALHDFSRVFVATPSLRRSGLVVSGRLKGGEAALVRAVEALSGSRAAAGAPRVERDVKLWPWRNRGPTERVVGLFPHDQIVIARPGDVARVLSVSAALARRHAAQPGMEKAQGPAALLSLYEGEAIALSVEGVRQFLAGELSWAPSGLRISLRHLDEFHAELRVFGYYGSAQAAREALAQLEALRAPLAAHRRSVYLGLRSAIEEATAQHQGNTITLRTRLTMHQTRYLLAFVSRALRPRD